MTIAEVITNKKTEAAAQPAQQQPHSRCCLELMRFFGVHPNSRFSKLAIIHAVDENGRHLEVERALAQLTSEGVLKTDNSNGTSFYLLSHEEAVMRRVLALARFDWLRWQWLLKTNEGGAW